MCLNHKSESGCQFCDKSKFIHTEAGAQPSKKSKKDGAKGSVALLKETVQLGCVYHVSPQRKSILREKWKVGIESHSQVLQGHDASHKKSGKEGPSQGIILKPQERNPWAPKFEEKRKTLGNWPRMFLNSKKRSQKTRSTLLPRLG